MHVNLHKILGAPGHSIVTTKWLVRWGMGSPLRFLDAKSDQTAPA